MNDRTLNRRGVVKIGGVALAVELAPAETPKRGGVFRIRGEDPLGFDPQLTTTLFRTMINVAAA